MRTTTTLEGALQRLSMTLMLVMLTSLSAWADNVTFIDANGTEQTVDATSITSATAAMGSADQTTWYYVSGTVENDNRIELSGIVNLILANGCDFKANHGLHLASGNTLNVYVQSALNGKLYASYSVNDAAIGGNGGKNDVDGTNGEDAGNVNIYGGVIEINGNIGGGDGGNGYGVYLRTDQDSQWVVDGWDEYGNPINQHEEFTYTDIYEGGNGGDGGNSGTIYIYGGQVYIYGGIIGGGRGGYGNETSGNDGSGTIYLSWKNATDYVHISGYNGTVTLQEDFTDEEHHVYAKGVHDNIDNVKLLPTTAAVEYHAEAAPTCTEVGYTQDCWYNYLTEKYYTDEACTQAHEIAASAVVIPALGHNIEHHAAQSATFTTAGNLEYWHCDRCDKYFGDANGENDLNLDDASALYYSVEGNATDGYSIRIPETGTHTLTLNNSVTTFKIYDDGGEGGSTTENDLPGNYSNYCDGRLVLIAPENHSILLTGDVMTESGDYDYLTVYRGTTADDNNILLNHKYSDTPYVASSIGSLTATSMLLYFHSDLGVNRAGLDLTATLIYNLNETDGITAAIVTKIAGKPSQFTRSFTSGKASTICLPFPMTSIEGGTVYEFVGVTYDNTDGWVATMSDATPNNNNVTSTTANKPYLFMPNATGDVTFTGTIASVPAEITAGSTTSTDWTFNGTYSRLTYSDDLNGQHIFGFAASATAEDKEKGQDAVTAGEFVKAIDGAYFPAFRAYLAYTGTEESLKKARAMRGGETGIPEYITVRLIGKSGEIDGIGEIRLSTGEVTFDPNAWYDLNGRRLAEKPTQKGIYINKGKKITIK